MCLSPQAFNGLLQIIAYNYSYEEICKVGIKINLQCICICACNKCREFPDDTSIFIAFFS